MQWRNERPSKYLRSFRFNLNQWAGWNFDGDLLNSGVNVNAHAVFPNQWSTGMGAEPLRAAVRRPGDARRPGRVPQRPAQHVGVLSTATSASRSASTSSALPARSARARPTGRSAPTLGWRPSSFISASAGVYFNHNDQRSQWVENTADGRYVFGRIDQRTVSLTTRLNYTVTPQPLRAALRAAVRLGRRLRRVQAAGRTAVRATTATRYGAVDYFGNPDFNYRSFRTTNVVRWEYRPGSTLFVVWQQGREDVDRTRQVRLPQRRLQRVRRAGAQRLPGEVGVLAELLIPASKTPSVARTCGVARPAVGGLLPLFDRRSALQVSQFLARTAPPSVRPQPQSPPPAPRARCTLASAPKPRIQLRSAKSFDTFSVTTIRPSALVANLLRRVPQPLAHVGRDARLERDLDALGHALVDAERVREGLLFVGRPARTALRSATAT